MICKKCNTALPDTAKFCMECGEPQCPPEATNSVRWETCEIVCLPNSKGNREWEFRAEAKGVRGNYIASDPFVTTINPLDNLDALTDDRSKYVRYVVFSLVRTLMQAGWEPLNLMGAHWFSYRFRRKVQS